MQVKTVNNTNEKMQLSKVRANEQITVQPLSIVQINITVELDNNDKNTSKHQKTNIS